MIIDGLVLRSMGEFSKKNSTDFNSQGRRLRSDEAGTNRRSLGRLSSQYLWKRQLDRASSAMGLLEMSVDCLADRGDMASFETEGGAEMTRCHDVVMLVRGMWWNTRKPFWPVTPQRSP